MEKSLLVIIGGKINRYYRTYKEKIKEKFKVRQVKPYVIEFPQRLTEEEIKNISDWLDRINTNYEWFIVKG